MCDKYDCVRPLRFMVEKAVRSRQSNANPKELQQLLIVSYVFDLPQFFPHLSGKVIREFFLDP